MESSGSENKEWGSSEPQLPVVPNEEEAQQTPSFGDDANRPTDDDGDSAIFPQTKTPKRVVSFSAGTCTDIESHAAMPPFKTEDACSSTRDNDEEDVDSASPELIGGTYTQHEFAFVMVAGVLLAFNAGYVNGSCLSGFLTDDGDKQSVAGFTGAYTQSALALAGGNFKVFGTQVCMILSMIFGACISGLMNPNASPYRIEPSYGPTFMIGGIFLLIASLLAAFETNETHSFYLFYFAAAANGIQNGISSLYSANLIRSTHLTGASTDIGLFIGQLLRGNRTNLWKLLVLIALASSFWLGGIISFYATSQFAHYSLLFNAALFLLIGASLVFFLVHELHISVSAALMGTWMWKRVMNQVVEKGMRTFTRGGAHMASSDFYKSQHLSDYFDHINQEGDEVTEQELLVALHAAGVKVSKESVKVLMRSADEDNNGSLSKDEWKKVARACRTSSER
jgi:uncharacterized membrane protein YoaK (UPF0700 family)